MPPRILAKASPNIFVNRETPLALIDEAIDEIPANSVRLLVFHGIGGQGKTALCRYVLKRVSNSDEKRYSKLRTAEIDLKGRDKTDPINLLIWIRNGFAKAKVACPAFDIALALTWEATRPEQTFPKLTNSWLAKSSELMTETAPDTITALREVVEKSAEIIPGLGPLITRGSKWVIDKGKSVYLHDRRPYLNCLYEQGGELKKPYELEALLPSMLAEDLKTHLKEKPWNRYLLLIDEYEGVFDHGGAGKKWQDNSFDKTLREFIAKSNGLLAIFFSREPLPWEKSDDWKNDLKDKQYELSGLIDDDARKWLSKAGVANRSITDAMIEGSREAPGKNIYPLLLELQFEHWRQLNANDEPVSENYFHISAEGFSGRCEEIVRRVLRDYGPGLELAIERLSVCSRFDKETFKYAIDKFGIALSAESFDQISELSLFKKYDNGYISMHRAFAEIVSNMIGTEKRRESIKLLLNHFQIRMKSDTIHKFGNENVSALFEAAYLRLELSTDGYVDWLIENTSQISQAGREFSVEQLWRQALAVVNNCHGVNTLEAIVPYYKLATSLHEQGRYEEAEDLYMKGLEICKSKLDETHPDTAKIYILLANNLDYQARHVEAEVLYRKCLDIRQQELGDTHPDIVDSYNCLAGNLNAQGNYKEAEILVRKALKILNNFDEQCRDTDKSYLILAYNLDYQSRHEEATPLYQKCLDIRKRFLGNKHPDTATSYNGLAYNLDYQSKHVEAEDLHKKSLQIRRQVLGETHPETASSYHNLAKNLDAQERYAEAEPFFQDALNICRDVLGESHPYTEKCYNSLGYNLESQGRHDDAKLVFQRKTK